MAQKADVYLKQFKDSILILLSGILLSGFFISKIIPSVQDFIRLSGEYKTQSSALADKQRSLEDLKSAAKKKEDMSSALKAFYRPVDKGMDSESILASEFNEILQLVRLNSIKTRSVKYEYDPADDNFVKSAGEKYSVCKLDMEMIASYQDFENFLRDLFKHEHFLDISKIEIVPYERDKKILLINFQLKLYAQK